MGRIGDKPINVQWELGCVRRVRNIFWKQIYPYHAPLHQQSSQLLIIREPRINAQQLRLVFDSRAMMMRITGSLWCSGNVTARSAIALNKPRHFPAGHRRDGKRFSRFDGVYIVVIPACLVCG